MKKTKLEKGITLVALIITIVVLLILAVVSIGAVRNSGIIGHATNTSDSWKEAQAKENTYLQEYEGKIKEIVNKPISDSESYVGCYADIDDDGVVDGIIYADLAFNSVDENEKGSWGDNNIKYSYTKEENLDSYYISGTFKANDGFGEKSVIAPKNKEDKNDRFYVMALTDFEVEGNVWFRWYYAVGSSTNKPTGVTSLMFGKGKENTITMINACYNNIYGDSSKNDIWMQFDKNTENLVWFVPSQGELAAFCGNLDLSKGNYESCGLERSYMSSSYADDMSGYFRELIYSLNGMTYGSITGDTYRVRLSATF